MEMANPSLNSFVLLDVLLIHVATSLKPDVYVPPHHVMSAMSTANDNFLKSLIFMSSAHMVIIKYHAQMSLCRLP